MLKSEIEDVGKSHLPSATSLMPSSMASLEAKTVETRPNDFASEPENRLPVSANSTALPYPTMLGSRWSVPTSAVIARSTSFTEKNASSVQNLMSQAVTTSIPAPMQAPWIPAITGFRQCSIAVMASCKNLICRRSLSPVRPRSLDWERSEMESKTFRSMPEQKWAPFPERIMTLTLGFWSRESRALGNSEKKSRERAFRREGRLRLRWKTEDLGLLWTISRVL